MIYWVKSDGSDAADGKSYATAWQTISKVRGFDFNPGDIVQFRQGDLFNFGGLAIDSTKSHHVTFRSFDPLTGAPGGSRARWHQDDVSTGSVFYGPDGVDSVVLDQLDISTVIDTADPAVEENMIANAAAGDNDDWTIHNCLIHGAGADAIAVNGELSTGWKVIETAIYDVAKSAVLFNQCGAGHELAYCSIHDVGLHDVGFDTHAIFGAAADLLVHHNDIYSCISGHALSMRYDGAEVHHNRIHDLAQAFGFLDYSDASTGKVLWYNNLLWNIDEVGWWNDGDNWRNNAKVAGVYGARLGNSTIDHVIASNTILMAANMVAEAVAAYASQHCDVTIANNVIACLAGTAGYGIEGSVPDGGKTWTEKNNLVYGFANFGRWKGLDAPTLADWVAADASGGGTVVKGLNDLAEDPLLTAQYTPGGSSPLIGAGTDTVDSDLTYTGI